MYRTRTGLLAAALGLSLGAVAFSDEPLAAPLLHKMIAGRMTPCVIAGRIVNMAGWHFGNGTANQSNGDVKEQVVFRGNGGAGSLSYERTSPQDDFLLEINSEGRFHFRRRSQTQKVFVPVEFTQVPGEPLSLALGPEGRQQVNRAPTLWHLLLAQPESCHRHVIPALEVLRSQWQFSQTAASIETQLLQMAAGSKREDRLHWNRLVEDLADGRFATREAADRELRAAGPSILGYLNQLDFKRLDAEQQFRVRRVITCLARHATDDTPEQVAASLVEDPWIWAALLSRPAESTRRTAVRRLTEILGEPIGVDPAADPASQKSRCEELRAKVEKKIK